MENIYNKYLKGDFLQKDKVVAYQVHKKYEYFFVSDKELLAVTV